MPVDDGEESEDDYEKLQEALHGPDYMASDDERLEGGADREELGEQEEVVGDEE